MASQKKMNEKSINSDLVLYGLSMIIKGVKPPKNFQFHFGVTSKKVVNLKKKKTLILFYTNI